MIGGCELQFEEQRRPFLSGQYKGMSADARSKSVKKDACSAIESSKTVVAAATNNGEKWEWITKGKERNTATRRFLTCQLYLSSSIRCISAIQRVEGLFTRAKLGERVYLYLEDVLRVHLYLEDEGRNYIMGTSQRRRGLEWRAGPALAGEVSMTVGIVSSAICCDADEIECGVWELFGACDCRTCQVTLQCK